MCNSTSSIGFYLLSRGVSLADLQLPGTLSVPRGCVQRLAADGVIAKNGRIYRNHAVRRTWKHGPNWDRLERWMAAHGYI